MRNLIAAAALALTIPASAQNLSQAYSGLSAQLAASRAEMARAAAEARLAAAAAASNGAADGDPAPAFTLRMPSGGTQSLSDYRGRVVVLEFWAGWSGPSRTASPARTALARRLSSFGVVMLDVGVGETAAGAKAFAAAAAPADNEVILLDADQAVFNAYGGQGLPLAVVVGKDGSVAATIPGADAARVDAAVRAAL